jgi:hypothetical protein|tara:strand:+ start:3416 stop:4084 length:669 start_codon:yes stop_codon:yes gene_type:complete
MAKRKIYNNITEEHYIKAIDWLEGGGTKKGACDILGVKSNSVMSRLVEEYLDKKEVDKVQRSKKRKTAVSKDEVVMWITDYLNGYGLQELSDTHYRSTDVIKDHLEKNGAMLRFNGKIDPLHPPLMPDQCMSESFDDGQYVWSAKYGCIAQIKGKYKNAYRIQVLGNGLQEQSYQSPVELGCLKHLEELGVNLAAFEDYMKLEEVQHNLANTLRAANKGDKK